MNHNSKSANTTVQLVAEGVLSPNDVLNALQQDSRTSSTGGEHQLIIADAGTYLADSPNTRTNELLRQGKSILLLNASETDKQALKAHIGLGAPGDSKAYLIAARPGQGNRLVYHLWDLPVESNLVPTLGQASFEGTYPDGAPQPVLDTAPKTTETEAASPEEAFVQEILAFLGTPPLELDTTSTQQPEQQQWIFNQTLNWGCSQGNEHYDITPLAQNTYITVTFTFIVYLDEEATGQFQWLYLEVLGYQSVGASGMNQNYYDQMGWANGHLQVQVPIPSNFSVYQSSPNNVNNETTYTTEVSMQIGVSGDVSGDGPSGGASASVSVSHSQTETITDWGLAQNDVNNWTFYQQNPWDSRKETWQDDMENYNAGKARHELNELPNLSTGVMNFSTMSVWKNQAVSLATVPVTINLSAYFNYVGIKNVWPTYHGEWWGLGWGPYGFTYSIDLSMVS